MRRPQQLRLPLGGRRQQRPASLLTRLAQLCRMPPQLAPPREPIAATMLVNGFLFRCSERGIVGPRDLRDLKVPFDAYADAENHDTLTEQELAKELTNLGIAHGRRDLQPCERGYRRALLETETARPQIIFFVMPPKYPIERPFQRRRETLEPASPPRQEDLFPPPEEDDTP